VTTRFPAHEPADEREWQEQIVQHLGLRDWVKLDCGEEFHVLGPIARDIVRRHGVVFPPNAYLHTPLFDVAQTGVLLTGLGGDEIVGGVRWSRTAAVLAREKAPRFRDLRGVGYALTPITFRRVLSRRGLRGISPWLRPQARREAVRRLAAYWGGEPIPWADRLRWWLEAPYIQAAQNTLDVLAADHEARTQHPLLDARFVASIARLPFEQRWSTRSSGMRGLFADLLPDEALCRPGKASFAHIFAPGPRLELVQAWNGEGIDEDLVDPAELRRTWSGDPVDPSSIPLLQQVADVLERSSPRSGREREHQLEDTRKHPHVAGALNRPRR
jgi:asparagine synthase (glutamine-hydrolysing)